MKKLRFKLEDIISDSVDTGKVIAVYETGIYGGYHYNVLVGASSFKLMKDDEFTYKVGEKDAENEVKKRA